MWIEATMTDFKTEPSTSENYILATDNARISYGSQIIVADGVASAETFSVTILFVNHQNKTFIYRSESEMLAVVQKFKDLLTTEDIQNIEGVCKFTPLHEVAP